MEPDPFDAYKRDAEDHDLTVMLAADARAILGRLDFDWREDWQSTAHILYERGSFSISGAMHILEFIDWEESRDRNPTL